MASTAIHTIVKLLVCLRLRISIAKLQHFIQRCKYYKQKMTRHLAKFKFSLVSGLIMK